jgi:O-methyltransferase involved in polyketide biosynthesis
VLDNRWTDTIDARDGLLLTAQGLLMYLQPSDVHRLIAGWAERFQSGGLLFDAVPRWFSNATLSGRMQTSGGYQTPPMPWAMDRTELDWIRAIPHVEEVRELRWPRGRGQLFGWLIPVLSTIGVTRVGLPFLPWRIMLAWFG